MNKLTLGKYHILVVVAVLAATVVLLSCRQGKQENVKSSADKARENVVSWMESMKLEYPGYQPAEFGELTPRYNKSNITFHLYNLIEQERSKPSPSERAIDSLENLLRDNPGELLGYSITHKYNVKDISGEIRQVESLFLLDTLLRVITVLDADAYDQIMDEELFFRPESKDSTL